MHPVASLLIGLVCAGVGGEMFVRGAVGLAAWMRVPAGIIGSTVAAFATSSPEMAVSVNAALAGTPQIALGDALGSNVVNVALILGVALLLGPMAVSPGSARRDAPVALAVPVLTGIFVADGTLARFEGAILLFCFLVWLGASIRAARADRANIDDSLGEMNHRKAITSALLGLGLLVLAGDFIVVGAKWAGDLLGWSPFLVGATLVSIGTSMPELATTLISRIRKHDEVGLGTVLGSNIFNGLLIVGVAAVIAPIKVAPTAVLSGLLFGVLSVALALPGKNAVLGRGRGIALVGLYVAYVVALVSTG